jgi:8-oxo-dGTP pyrophosphatase MutT (NUDIX family)
MPPGGKQEANEGIISTASREFEEETGLKVKNLRLKIIGTHNHSYKDKVYMVFVFIGDFDSGLEIDSNEGTLEWHTEKELLDEVMLWPDLKIYIPHVVSESNKIMFSYLEYNENLEIVKKSIEYT